jgi:hypothetical protein
MIYPTAQSQAFKRWKPAAQKDETLLHYAARQSGEFFEP